MEDWRFIRIHSSMNLSYAFIKANKTTLEFLCLRSPSVDSSCWIIDDICFIIRINLLFIASILDPELKSFSTSVHLYYKKLKYVLNTVSFSYIFILNFHIRSSLDISFNIFGRPFSFLTNTLDTFWSNLFNFWFLLIFFIFAIFDFFIYYWTWNSLIITFFRKT